MNRFLATIGLFLFCDLAYAHDFGWVLYGQGFAVVSFALSIYVVGRGNRAKWLLFLLAIWVLLWATPLVTDNLLPIIWGTVILIFVQPIAAYLYKTRIRVKHEN